MMLTLFAIVFAFVGYRAPLLKRSHFVWVAVVAAVGVFSVTDTAHKVAAEHGAKFAWSLPRALEGWAYSVAYIVAGLVLGFWLGHWRRTRKALAHNDQNSN
jgi:fructose-specific phosphotransferase system IIC component